jgi:hypothetical protein
VLLRSVACLSLLLVGAYRPLFGQRLGHSPFPTLTTQDLLVGSSQSPVHKLATVPAPLVPVRADSAHRDYRWEGLIIGGLALGVLGAVVGNGLCHDDTSDEHCAGSTILYGLVGATVGGVTGGLIGASIPKD